MRVVHAGTGPLSDAVRPALEAAGDQLLVVDDLAGLEAAVADAPADWLVSAGFRSIVPEGLLARFGDACNLHPALLPWGRGAHPNVWAIVDGEPAGVTLHRMTAGLDRGPVFAQRPVATTPADDGASLYRRLLEAGRALFAEAWPELRAGTATPTPQPEGGSHHRAAELAQLGSLDPDEQVSWRHAVDVLRALTFPPHPNAVIELDGRRYHVEVWVRELPDPERP